MTVSGDAATLINVAKYSWLDKVYKGYIPKAHLNDTDSTDCLITENVNTPVTFGNDDFSEMQQGVAIHLFYSKSFSDDPDECEVLMMKLFMSNSWVIDNSDARYTDPDTGQSIKVLYVSHKKRIGD